MTNAKRLKMVKLETFFERLGRVKSVRVYTLEYNADDKYKTYIIYTYTMTLGMLCIFLVKVLWQKQPVQFILLARIAGSGSGRKRQCFRTSRPH